MICHLFRRLAGSMARNTPSTFVRQYLAACLVFGWIAMAASAAESQKGSFFKRVFDVAKTQPLGQEELISGLKEALGNGVTHAVTNLNREGGFLSNLDVRIELPQKLAKVEKTLRALNQGPLVDQFVTNMNRAAEIAIGEAGPIFGDAVKSMTIADAEKILHGPEDAATQYFRKVSEKRLKEKMQPIIEQATAKAGATATYKSMVNQVQSGFSFLSAFGKPFDVDDYVNQKAADGVFTMIAEQEKKIRQNPAGQASELLQKVFGSRPAR